MTKTEAKRTLSAYLTHLWSKYGKLSVLFVVSVFFVTLTGVFSYTRGGAQAAPASYLNFQGRLLATGGNLVADGTYNIEFNLYTAASGGSTQWTEDYLNTGTPVTVKNGFFSVNLGSVTAFPGTINWDQQQYLGMTVRGTGSCAFGSCTPTDSEMTPRFSLTAVPRAFSAANVNSGSTSAASTNSAGVGILSGNATGVTSNSGNITIDSGTATGTTGTITLGASSASALTLGRAGLTTTNAGALTVTQAGLYNGGLTVATGSTFTNASSTLLTALAVVNQAAGGNIPAGGAGNTGASTTVDVATTFNVNQTTASQTLTLPTPTVTTAGRIVYVNNVGSTSFVMHGSTIAAGGSSSFMWTGTAWVTSISLSSNVVTGVGAIDGGTYSANGASISGSNIFLQTATNTNTGLVNATTQTFGGAKTFTGNLTATGTALFQNASNSANTFQIQNAAGTSLINVDTSTNRLNVYTQIEATDNISSPFGGIGTIGNLMFDGEAFVASANWANNNITSVTDGATAPDNSATADTIISSGAGTHTLVNTIVLGNSTYTFSVWLKAGSGTQPITLRIDSNGTPVTGTAASYTLDTTWRRYSVTQTISGATTQVMPTITITSNSATIIAWGAQTQTGTSMGVYTAGSSAVAPQSGASVNGTLRVTQALYFGTGDTNSTTSLTVSALDTCSGCNFQINTNTFSLADDGGVANAISFDTTSRTIKAGDVTLAVGKTLTVAGGAGNGGNNGGGLLTLQGGLAIAAGTGGGVTVAGGRGGTTGTGGALNLNGGQGGTTNAAGGAVSLQGGTANATTTGGVGGNVAIQGGTSSGSNANNGGNITLTGGTPSLTGAGGGITLTTGAGGATSGNSGAITLQSGNVTSGNAGNVGLDVGSGTTSGTPAINIGNSTNSPVKTITVGGTSQTGIITLGQSTATNIIAIGNTNTATGNTQTINIGAGAPVGTGLTAITIGNALNGSSVSIQGGSGGIAIGTVAATQNIIIGNTTGGSLTVKSVNQTFGNAAGSGVFTNNGATVNTTLVVGNDTDGGALGGTPASPLTAAASVDIYTSVSVAQTTAGQTLTLPTPTANTAYGRILYLSNVGTTSFIFGGVSVSPGSTATLIWSNTNGGASWQFAGADGNGVLNQNASDQTANFRISGTGRANTSITTPLVDSITGALSIGTGTASSVTIGNATNNSAILIDSGTSSIGIGTGAQARTINLGTGAAVVQTINIGGTGANVIGLGNTQTAGIIAIGTALTSSTITLGGAGTSATTIQAGSGNLTLGASTILGTVATQNLFNTVATTINFGGVATAISIGSTSAGTLTVNNPNQTFGNAAGSGVFTNNGATVNATLVKTDFATGGSIGSAATTVDIYTSVSVAQTTAGQTITLPTPTATTAYGRILYISNVGTAGFTLGSATISPGTTATLIWSNTNITPSWQFAGADASSILNQNTADQTANFRITGTGRANTSFTAPLIDSITGALSIGTASASSVTIGNATNNSGITIDSGTGAISIGTGAQVRTTNIATGAAAQTVTLGSTFAGSTLTLGANGAISLAATGATFTAGARTLGIAVQSSNIAGGTLTVSAGAGGAGASAVVGGTLILQGGAAGGTGNINGGGVTITGGAGTGTGVLGLVSLAPTTFLSGSTQSYGSSSTLTNIDTLSTIPVNATALSLTLTVPVPNAANQVVGRILYVTAVNGSNDFSLFLSGSSISIAMKANSTATLIWNGSGWTAAGASSSTDLQSAYNNTLTSAGGAELVLAAPGGSADGLTIRNNATPITGALLEVQTGIGSNLFSVNNNATEYATNGGAETQGASSTAFPASSPTWITAPNGGTTATITRDVTLSEVATGQGSVKVVTAGTTANQGADNQLSTTLTANLQYYVSFTIRGSTNFSLLDVVYSKDGTNTGTTACATGQTVTTSVFTRITCTFTAPSSGITSSNAIFIRESDTTVRTFYIDNLSVAVNASVNHAIDGSVDSALGTNWVAIGGSVARSTTVLYDTSGALAATTTATAGRGVYNNLSNGIVPQLSTQYRVTFYARGDGTNTATLAVAYTPDNNATSVSCLDYSTQVVAASAYTLVSCLLTTSATAPVTSQQLRITQTAGSATVFYVDALSITLNSNNASNVQIGGANKGGPVTLFTLDRASSAPIAANNDAYLGSMYYNTTTGRIQCYESNGWGACGSAPDNIVSLTPEFAGAVLNGTGIGTMTADFCANQSGVLTVNASLCDGTGTPAVVGGNFYKWTSPQATQQTYSIYVTYQLPATFKAFSSDTTVQLTGRVDSTTNAAITYEMFRSEGGVLYRCYDGVTNETPVTTSANTWQTVGINGNEATGCGFTTSSAGASVVFKINLKANSNANAYVGNLSFTTTGK